MIANARLVFRRGVSSVLVPVRSAWAYHCGAAHGRLGTDKTRRFVSYWTCAATGAKCEHVIAHCGTISLRPSAPKSWRSEKQ
jgi:hypothetical protein